MDHDHLTTLAAHRAERAAARPHRQHPPQRPPRRPMTISFATAILALVIAVGWWSGALVPRLATEGVDAVTWSSRGMHDGEVVGLEVELDVVIVNRGRAPATVTDWRPPSTDGIEWHFDNATVPFEIPAGRRARLEVVARVDDCGHVVAAGIDRVALRSRGPLPLVWPRHPRVPAGGMLGTWPARQADVEEAGTTAPSWVHRALETACDPGMASDQEGPTDG